MRGHLLQARGTFGFEEFRRDPEDMGAWTRVAYYSGREFESEAAALAAARDAVRWLAAVLDIDAEPAWVSNDSST